jgi:predicted acylesterase/phospholipase RssA
MSAVERHLFSPGPKRILALDGGGVRGILTLAILERMEALLRERSATPDSFRLCDYFDLIGGTSTGSIIASGLAIGKSAQELLQLYKTLSARVFRRPPWSLGIFGPRFSRGPLAAVLQEIIGDITLGSDKIRTGLAIVTKRADNGSIWILHNNRAASSLPRLRAIQATLPTAISPSPRPFSPAPRHPPSSGRSSSRWRARSLVPSSTAASARTTTRRCICSCWRA